MNQKAQILSIRYEKGHSGLISGVNRKSAIKLERNQSVQGGCGTYRVKTGSELEVLVKFADNTKEFVNIKYFLKTNLNIGQITAKRLEIFKNTLIGRDIIIEVNEDYMAIPYDNEINKKIIEDLKKLIGFGFNSPQLWRVFICKTL
ncbi:MAG: hypothetical protein PHG82_03275 [Candidatus Gracilibacteria bacterium]|nr:hypothetical protein [Candidatus Gracilibacteria bacterium]